MKTILLSTLLLAFAGCSAMPSPPQTTAPNSNTSSPQSGSNTIPANPPGSAINGGADVMVDGNLDENMSGEANVSPVAEASGAVDLNNISQVVVGIGNRFFSARGESRPLQVQLKDANGQVIASEGVTYSYMSSRPQDFTVDASGQVVAQVSEGFSSITVRLNGSDKQATQLVSVSNAASGGSGGGGSSSAPNAPTEENVNGQVEFQF